MKVQKRYLICAGVLVAILAGIVATVRAGTGQVVPLSEAELGSLWGGDTWCVCDKDGVGGNCECKTSVDCEDIECSRCKYYDHNTKVNPYTTPNKYCRGKPENTTAVTACYYSPTASDACEYTGSAASTSCKAHVYSNDDCTTSIAFSKTVWRKLCQDP